MIITIELTILEINSDNNLTDDYNTTIESPVLKMGVKLPNSTNDWNIANS